MTAKEIILLYLMAAAIFFVIDLLWLGVFAKGFYDRHLGSFLRESVNWPAAGLFYSIYIAGILLFVVTPALQNGDGLLKTALMGGLLGFFAYATFDLTSLALIRGWPVIVVWIDMAWGALLTGTVSFVSVWLARLLL
jgi:uncharacterized membrane protein